MLVAAAPLVWEVALHALALVPAPEPGSLHDPRYLAWCRASLDERAWRPVADDAPVLTSLITQAGSSWWALQHLPFAHRDVDALVAAARVPVSDLAPGDPPHADAVVALQSLARGHEALVEIVRADVALVARPYASAFDATVAPRVAEGVALAEPSLRAALALAPSLARCDLRLSFALGARGRARGDTLLLGAPAAWNDLPPEHPAVLALHERAVTLAMREGMGGDARARWAVSEGVALCATEALVRESPLAAAWRRWRAEVDVRGVAAVGAEDARVARVVAGLRAR